MQPEAIVKVSSATLGLSDDVEVRQAAQAEVLAMHMRQVAPEDFPEGVEGRAEALGIEHVGVGQVGVSGVPPREFLVPTGTLAVRKEFSGDYREHLQSKKEGDRYNEGKQSARTCSKLGDTVTHTCKTGTREAEAGRSL